jgi:hypothetical protein
MIIKEADDKAASVAMLEQLLASASKKGQKGSIEIELRNLRAGLKAEKDAAYLIDFHYSGQNWAVIHDLRIEVDGRTAQIDHLLISRAMLMFLLETKRFHAGLKITDDGEFLRWNDYKKTYEGMASPIAQNERHLLVLKSLLKQLSLPTRMGMRLEPRIIPLVLVSPNARIDRSRKFDSSAVIKADALEKTVSRILEEQSPLILAKVVAPDTLETLAKSLVSHHRPASYDYAGRFGVPEPARPTPPSAAPEVSTAPPRAAKTEVSAGAKPWETRGDQHMPAAAGDDGSPQCRHCQSTDLSIAYGRYGYYFKCEKCQGNTPIKVSCGNPAHKERLRKDGRRFYRECAGCNTSTLFYENPLAARFDKQQATTRLP